MKFTKMHGLGNDYLYVYGPVPEDVAELSIKLSDRHFGAGSDGMIYIGPSEQADFQMRIFNADGSEAKMCGNGIRCVGKYVYDKGYTQNTSLRIETLSGIKTLTLFPENGAVKTVRVGMGQTEVEEEVCLEGAEKALSEEERKRLFPDGKICGSPVSVGNPHVVIFTDAAEEIPLLKIGPAVEHHPLFPDGVNTEFVKVVERNHLRMRVFERGSGVTFACGTGACASCAAAVKQGLCDAGVPIAVQLDGGVLSVEVSEDGTVWMTGPAEFVYEGSYPVLSGAACAE